jgi:catechol 2,3-dioxygenase-like lactoylglutathione lyase family enzyme
MMENVIAGLLKEFETGKMSRRQLIQRIALAATAAVVAPHTAAAQTGKSLFKTIGLDHIDYRVADYAKTRDFYIDIMGMVPMRDNGKNGVDLMFGGNSRLITRTYRPDTAAEMKRPHVDHFAFWVDDWNTDRVISELKKRGHDPVDDGGGYASYHIKDPDGFDLQISGLVKPGDSLYGKKLSEFRKVPGQ